MTQAGMITKLAAVIAGLEQNSALNISFVLFVWSHIQKQSVDGF